MAVIISRRSSYCPNFATTPVQVATYSYIELHHFDHAIWLHQRAISIRGDSQPETR